ncbi:MAG: thiol:disulfide oxidoreductase related to ResA [Bacteroidetes bacterium]|nr:thiol:disulfide oxidoreductase related to ResA [Bacteroidota bacterium]
MRYFLLLILVGIPAGLRAQLSNIYQLSKGRMMDSVYKSTLHDSFSISKLDDIRSYIAAEFAYERNTAKVDEYVGQLQYGPEKCNQYFRIARSFENASDLSNTERFAKLAVDTAVKYLDKQGNGVTPASILASSLVLLTGVLEKQEKYEEAIQWLTDKMGYSSEKNRPGLMRLKGDMLVRAARYKEALDTYTAMLKARAGGPAVEQKMKQAYIALHGADTLGFDTYLSGVKARITHEFSDSIRRSTVKLKAPVFELKDLEGKVVRLEDYVGKVVVLDFWATWCVPCKASFPAMQKAVNKYGADTSVVFLFIDTWEYSNDVAPAINDFLGKKQYTFRVLRDEKDAVVKQYGVDGIPAKFIIDKEGYIRFSMKGSNGTEEEAVNELEEMITLSRGGSIKNK